MLTGSTTDSFTIVEIEVCHLKKCDLNDEQQSQAAPNWSSHLHVPKEVIQINWLVVTN